MRLIAVGRMRPGPEAALYDRYAARLRPPLTLIEVPDGQGAPAEAKRREGAALLAASQGEIVALDLGGASPSSDGVARLLERWVRPCFLIGGAEGLDAPVLSRAAFVLSLGPLTWPHMLVRALLAEQLYRAQSILAGHPYHRSGRP